MARCLIGVGSNLGDRDSAIESACNVVRQHRQVFSFIHSTPCETLPIGGEEDQSCFLNSAACFETPLLPEEVLRLLQDVEKRLGRTRSERWSPRTIDLDLLLYGDFVIETPNLTVPHPRMGFRRFVLEPAVQIAPELVHPLIGWTIKELYENLNSRNSYIAITSPIPTSAVSITKAVVQNTDTKEITEENKTDLSHRLNPGSDPFQRESMLLVTRAELLSNLSFQRAEKDLVSDFWFDESLAVAQTFERKRDAEKLRQRWEELRNSVLRPTLRIWVSPSGELDDRSQPLANAVESQFNRPGQGPYLRISESDWEWAIQDAVAAIEAMR